jgi:hypothetical protein
MHFRTHVKAEHRGISGQDEYSDGYNILPLLTGETRESPRKEIFYFSDDGDLTALRYRAWKLIFMEQKAVGTLRVWMEPFVPLRVSLIFNLRRDPYERATITSNTYHDWQIDRVFLLVPAQTYVAQFLTTFTDLVYKPMLEVLSFLRAKGFKTFIVSGGGVEFMRVFSERVYGIPPEQVIGSSIETKYELREGRPVLVRLPEIRFINDKAGKPVGIQQHIGCRPIAAFGNSDGDFQMLEWTTAGPGARLGIIVRHDDAAREYAYDRKSPIGKFDRGLDEAPKREWTVVSMKNDWKTVFPPGKE